MVTEHAGGNPWDNSPPPSCAGTSTASECLVIRAFGPYRYRMLVSGLKGGGRLDSTFL